ncbi:MAG: HlyD family efflux transporter periplasmic adaptor subunit [Candidatus Korobacteraceae bacterium]
MSIAKPFSTLIFCSAVVVLGTIATGCAHNSSNGYQGYVEGKFVYVASPEGGRLDTLSVKRGESVTVNRPLFTLDHEPEASAELQAQQLLRADEARLADLQTGKRLPEVDVIRAQLAQAAAEKQKAVEILKSYESQYASGGIALTDLISARAAVQTDTAVVRQYESDLAVAALPGRDQQLTAQAQVVASDRAAVQQADWKARQKQIASPRDGLVFDTLYRQGEWVAAGNPVIQILPPDEIDVRFFVPETVVGSLKIGQTITVHCDGCAAPVPALITFISTQVEYTPPVIYSNENRSKLVLMVIAKPSLDEATLLHPGQPVEVTLQ